MIKKQQQQQQQQAAVSNDKPTVHYLLSSKQETDTIRDQLLNTVHLAAESQCTISLHFMFSYSLQWMFGPNRNIQKNIENTSRRYDNVQ